MRINLVGVALGTAVLLTACERGPTTTIVDYQCGALAVTAEFNQTGATLQVGEHRTLLQQDISASGARYTNAEQELEFWTKGPEAQLTIGGQAYPLCLDVTALPQQFSARGNEPFWLIQHNPTSTSLRQPKGDQDFAEIRVTTNNTQPAQWQLQLNDNTELTIIAEFCHDSMTGMPYPYSATLTMADQSYPGCAGEPHRLFTGALWELHASGLEAAPSIQFTDQGTVFGFSGCNRFHGGYELTGEGLRFQSLAATKMMCSGPQMEVEQQIFSALEQVNQFDIGDNASTLQLKTNDKTVLRFVKAF